MIVAVMRAALLVVMLLCCPSTQAALNKCLVDGMVLYTENECPKKILAKCRARDGNWYPYNSEECRVDAPPSEPETHKADVPSEPASSPGTARSDENSSFPWLLMFGALGLIGWMIQKGFALTPRKRPNKPPAAPERTTVEIPAQRSNAPPADKERWGDGRRAFWKGGPITVSFVYTNRHGEAARSVVDVIRLAGQIKDYDMTLGGHCHLRNARRYFYAMNIRSWITENGHNYDLPSWVERVTGKRDRSWDSFRASNAPPPEIAEAVAAVMSDLESLGWRLVPTGESIAMHGRLTTGEVLSTPSVELNFSPPAKSKRTGRERPWRVDSSRLNPARSFSQPNEAVALFMQEARAIDNEHPRGVFELMSI